MGIFPYEPHRTPGYLYVDIPWWPRAGKIMSVQFFTVPVLCTPSETFMCRVLQILLGSGKLLSSKFVSSVCDRHSLVTLQLACAIHLGRSNALTPGP